VDRTEPTTRAVIYCRVSTDEQARDGLGLSIQLKHCRAYAVAQGWSVVETFTDAGVSGAKASRPALDEMLAYVQTRGVNIIVVAKLDRLGRYMRHLSPLLGSLDDRGVSLVSIAEAFDSGSTGRLMRNVLGSIAEWERGTIRDRTRAGVKERVSRGGWGGGSAPFGYKVVGVGPKAHLEIDDREAQVVRQAVALILDQGLSTLEAAKRLNALGLTPRAVPLWTSQNLRNCMRRGQWDGQWTYGKAQSAGSTFAPLTVPIDAVLDAARAAALKAHLDRTKLIPRGTGVHPLSGRLICRCGERMTGIIRSDRANRRYRCRRAHQVPGRPFCHEPSVLADKVDDAVWAQVLDLLMDPDLLMALASERLDMLRGAARVTVDSLGDAEAAVMRTQRALASAAAKCLTLDLDEGTTMATLAELREQHREAVQHRAMVAAMNQETADATARMVTAQQLAAVARERLQNADRTLQAKVFALLDVRVTILAHGDQVRVRVEGSVAHDLLLSSVGGGLAPSKLASHGA
jgi:DNA invertase Pin-like site-specific DNA recombinase